MRPLPFFVDDHHIALAEPGRAWTDPNIGADGRNLTVVLLSLNRAGLTIRMIDSLQREVPHFAGHVLIADNGSAASELAALRGHLEAHCRLQWRILELGRNHGVAGGRNIAFREAATEWVLSLDNDIFLVADPFPTLQRDIGLLGARFLSVPLLNPDRESFYSFGGHLQLSQQDGVPRLTLSSLLPAKAALATAADIAPGGQPFLCSFLFGGASLLHREAFLETGGFDDAMLVGFEDLDFSLRLFRRGMKVGSSAVQAFVHDHPAAESRDDRDYERARYARETLMASARHMERRTGFRVWNEGVDAWLRDNERKQGFSPGAADATAPAASRPGPARPRIALVTDVEGWAFDNIAHQIKRRLGHRYQVDIIPLVRLGEIQEARWREGGSTGRHAGGGASALGQVLIQAADYDIIHVFWREYLTLIGTPLMEDYAAFLGLSPEAFEARFVRGACITSAVYDHLHGDAEAIAPRRRIFNDIVAAYTVSSARLDRHYRAIPDLRPPAMVIEDGVDTGLFRPQRLERFDDVAAREVVIGWVGNSGWAATLEDFKGVHSILVPAVEQLRAEGLPLRLQLADRQERHLPHAEMPAYYAAIDLYVCTSKIEGTPNPVLEAMACGVPVISTDVGIVPEVFGPLQRGFILEERSIEALKRAIRRMLAEPALFRRLSAENLRAIEPWAWHWQVEKFDRFFRSVLRQRARARGEAATG